MLSFFASMPPCSVGMEASASAHYWAREIGRFGHTVRLLPPQYVRSYVKRHKNDTADAEAICEAVQRPTMRFVSIKSEEQQALLLLHRGRETLVGQRIQLINTIRGYMAEFGIVATRGGQRPAADSAARRAGRKLHSAPCPARPAVAGRPAARYPTTNSKSRLGETRPPSA